MLGICYICTFILQYPLGHFPSSKEPAIPAARPRHESDMAQPQSAMSSIIPPPDPLHPRARTLVLCFDGTGDQFDADVSALAIVTPESSANPVSELECHPVLHPATEGRSYTADGLLPGMCFTSVTIVGPRV